MTFNYNLFIISFVIFLSESNIVNCKESVEVEPILDIASLNRYSFPQGFIFGAGSSSYQFEGAAAEGGRTPSIWDTFAHSYPEKIKDGSNGDIAIDTYHKYKEDVRIMKDMNLDSYRFSISWSRILPNGKVSGGVNQEGINYYNNLINELLTNGIQPLLTLFHWDLPQTLEEKYGGFLSPLIVKDFEDYAELCFKEFGDRVKYWVTLNEPWSYSQHGYANGRMAPGRCSSWLNLNCTGGDSATEPYIVTHNQLLAHAAAVDVYKKKYQESQNGVIGITMVANWYLPLSDSKSDQKAAERAIDFMYGWFMDPLTSVERNGKPIGIKIASDWLYVCPRGIRDILLYTKKKYNNPSIYITENGINEYEDPILSVEESLIDSFRIDYHYRHLFYLRSAIREGANVKGYYVWSLFDNFEWSSGYSVRFGMTFVDFKNDLKRYRKLSALWFKNFLKKETKLMLLRKKVLKQVCNV
ncbi:beta-glucosidase 24-like isoform X2 [Trifolium pratense]|uniref:beta-glucosidase 24-like isoform X2 n=1 Tax=Trifolium pratense TaxID=57577 RepID=UPI001E692CA8|nr:beta-glucosidase 24-like isoform X2 [Trifolium pratense]